MLPFEKKKRYLLVSFKKEVPRRYVGESGRTSVKDGGPGLAGAVGVEVGCVGRWTGAAKEA